MGAHADTGGGAGKRHPREAVRSYQRERRWPERALASSRGGKRHRHSCRCAEAHGRTRVPGTHADQSWVHVVLKKRLCPQRIGLLLPSTDDGRVLFMLPFFGSTLVGTTD